MKHFRLSCFLLTAGIIAAASVGSILFYLRDIPSAILAVIVLLCMVIWLWVVIRRLIHTMQSFVSGLEMADNSMRFNIGIDDPELHEMSEAMNRLTAIFRNSRHELETRKLYYDRILKIMTHEMRNAITPIISLASDIQSKPEKYKGDNLFETIAVIKDQSIEMKRFLDSYFELTHIPAPEKILVSVTEFMEGVQSGIGSFSENPYTERTVTFIVSPTARLWIDKGLMTQVMRNLIKNAIEATSSVDKPKIEVSATTLDDVSLITVTDNGKGIPDNILPNLFQPFTSSKRNGSGIGLFVSRQIVRLHGGDLIVRNHPGKGVQVQITLPLGNKS